MSAGIAEFPKNGDSATALLAIADARLYEAKRTGRNRVVMNDPPPAYAVMPRKKSRIEWM